MHPIIRLYQYINILSIDIVAGAVISALFFGKIFDVEIKTYGLIALGLTVWIIYTTDHLRDAKKIKHHASTERHRFHQQYFRTLMIFLCVAIALNAITIFFIRRQVLEWGLILSPLIILYLVVQQYLRVLKEFFIALLYTCGVLLLSITITAMEIGVSHYLIVIQFGFVAWINLLLFSWFDNISDRKDAQTSFVTIAGDRTTSFVLYGLFVICLLLTFLQFFIQGITGSAGVLFLMNTILFLIFLFRTALTKNDLYRLIGDAVFLCPVFYLI